MGQALATLPPGGAHIGHQGALLEGEKCYFSAVCGPIGFKLWWVVGTGHIYLSTRWRPYRPPGALLEGKKCYISAICRPIGSKLWGMVGTGHSYLATRWRPYRPPGALLEGQKCYFSAVCGPIDWTSFHRTSLLLIGLSPPPTKFSTQLAHK